jgi:hypothetical protein
MMRLCRVRIEGPDVGAARRVVVDSYTYMGRPFLNASQPRTIR